MKILIKKYYQDKCFLQNGNINVANILDWENGPNPAQKEVHITSNQLHQRILYLHIRKTSHMGAGGSTLVFHKLMPKLDRKTFDFEKKNKNTCLDYYHLYFKFMKN